MKSCSRERPFLSLVLVSDTAWNLKQDRKSPTAPDAPFIFKAHTFPVETDQLVDSSRVTLPPGGSSLPGR